MIDEASGTIWGRERSENTFQTGEAQEHGTRRCTKSPESCGQHPWLELSMSGDRITEDTSC